MLPALYRAIVVCLLVVIATPFLTFEHTVAESSVITYETFDTTEPVIALTFDVTFDRGDGEMILDILAARNVRATFGVTGVWALSNPDLMQRIVNEGHGLMNHTWDHPSLTGEYTGSTIHQPQAPQTHEQIIDQLQQTEDFIRDQLGVELRPYVRPPYGDYSEQTLAAFAEAGYTYNIMWTADTHGWHGVPIHEVHQRTIDAAQPGANILMHVGHGATDGAALAGIIDELRDMGYEFATVQDFVEGDLARPPSRYFENPDLELSGEFIRHWWRISGGPTPGNPRIAVLAHGN